MGTSPLRPQVPLHGWALASLGSSMDGEMERDFASPQLLGPHECSSGCPGTFQGALSQVPDFLVK